MAEIPSSPNVQRKVGFYYRYNFIGAILNVTGIAIKIFDVLGIIELCIDNCSED